MGANNHPTAVPVGEAPPIEYDDSPHDRYMKRLREALIERGVLDGSR